MCVACVALCARARVCVFPLCAGKSDGRRWGRRGRNLSFFSFFKKLATVGKLVFDRLGFTPRPFEKTGLSGFNGIIRVKLVKFSGVSLSLECKKSEKHKIQQNSNTYSIPPHTRHVSPNYPSYQHELRRPHRHQVRAAASHGRRRARDGDRPAARQRHQGLRGEVWLWKVGRD